MSACIMSLDHRSRSILVPAESPTTAIRAGLANICLLAHTGNLEISIPASAWVQIKARSMKNQSDPEFPIAGEQVRPGPRTDLSGETRKDFGIAL